jgi:hypothetical protein
VRIFTRLRSIWLFQDSATGPPWSRSGPGSTVSGPMPEHPASSRRIIRTAPAIMTVLVSLWSKTHCSVHKRADARRDADQQVGRWL